MTTGEHDTDNEIIGHIREGDARTFSLLVDRHKERGMSLAFRMLRNREEAEEALQDAFVRAFKALPGFEMKAAFSTWFYRIVFNVCATRLSRKGDPLRGMLEQEEEAFENRGSPDPLPDQVLESDQTAEIIQEEIGKIPEVYGTTFTLFALHERTYDEIVEITGVPLGTVKARLFRARTMLRDAVARRLHMKREKSTPDKGRAA